MKVGLKSLVIAMVLLLVAAAGMNDLNAQSRRGEQKVEKQSENVTVDAEEEGFTDFEEEADLEEEIEFEEKETPAKSLKKIEKNVPDKEYFIERELKRHENEMKKIKLTKKRANQMLKKCEEDEAKELKRHAEAVEEIKTK
ncbi:MAG: hypothetical protein JXN63_00635 [Candidatus Delongbacteria bacterium]|nr:hypothetical protein [Candidatus Delongbacteria bacterium]